jgi:hypothetical protein
LPPPPTAKDADLDWSLYADDDAREFGDERRAEEQRGTEAAQKSEWMDFVERPLPAPTGPPVDIFGGAGGGGGGGGHERGHGHGYGNGYGNGGGRDRRAAPKHETVREEAVRRLAGLHHFLLAHFAAASQAELRLGGFVRTVKKLHDLAHRELAPKPAS